MLKPLQFSKENGKYIVRLSLEFPHHEPLSEEEYRSLQIRCNSACVHPVVVLSGSLGAIALFQASFSSEEEAKSAQTEQTFRRSNENVIQVLKRDLFKKN